MFQPSLPFGARGDRIVETVQTPSRPACPPSRSKGRRACAASFLMNQMMRLPVAAYLCRARHVRQVRRWQTGQAGRPRVQEVS